MIDPSAPDRIRDDRPQLLPLAIAAAAVGIWALLALGSAAPARAGLLDASCFPGTASRNGKQPCSACAPGSFASGSGATSCELCPIGSFAAGSGNSSCQPCAAGTYADAAGSATCVRDLVSWPSEAEHCGNGDELETCIAQGIRDGGIVEIAANDIAAQSVTVTGKSFTLRPHPGFVPAFGAGTTIIARGSEADIEVVIEGLVLERGFIEASQMGPHRFEATIRGNEIQQFTGPVAAIRVLGAPSLPPPGAGPTHYRIEGNLITVDRSQTFASSIGAINAFFEAPGVANDLVIRGNTIQQRNTGQRGVIEIAVNASTLAADVIGNRIDGADFNGGVTISQFGAGDTSALVANNAVSGQVTLGGLAAAIGFRATDGTADLTVVNNTVAFNDTGLHVDGRFDPLEAVVANNLVAFNEFGLLALGEGVENASNLVFGNGDDAFTPGPGTIAADPLFVPDDLALGALSPARDAGDDAFVPLDLTLDLLGNPRIVGANVDIGAYEVPEPATGLGVSALAALAALRRHAHAPRRS